YIADIMYTIMAFFFFALASTVIINTTMMVIFERMREIGTISAMGMKGREIVSLFFTEAFYLGLIGSAAGVLLGIGLTLLLGTTGIDYTSSMEGIEFEVSSIIYPRLDLRSTLGTFLYSLAISSLASILPTRRAAKIEPVEALRHT
ncbi:MAG: FtsX-like permease family protein, partial [Spirochaetales bacterium]|nr:FtsX-like permease family protein [Spirochaetales bacterium]